MAKRLKKQKQSIKVFKCIRHKEFVDALFNTKIMGHNKKKIESKLHRIGTYDVCQISLFYIDDRRYILGDGIICLDDTYWFQFILLLILRPL